MSKHPPPNLVTAEQFYHPPDDGLRSELVRGTVVSEPSPNSLHGRTVARLAGLIEPFVRGHRLGVVFAADSGFVLARNPDTVRGPDVAFVSEPRQREAGKTMEPDRPRRESNPKRDRLRRPRPRS